MVKENKKSPIYKILYFTTLALISPLYALISELGLAFVLVSLVLSIAGVYLLRRSRAFLGPVAIVTVSQLVYIRLAHLSNHTQLFTSYSSVGPIRTLSVVFPCANEGEFAV